MPGESPVVLHSWRRFWCLREGTYSLHDGGFLVDPDNDFGKHFHEAHTLESLANQPCLVLLGEPGIGKSKAVEQECQRLALAKEPTLLVNLALVSTGDGVRAVLEQRVAAGAPIHVFLDGLDEGSARNPALASELATLLRALDRERFRLRVTSRTLEWPAELEGSLKELWGKETARVYELLPLRRKDVATAAQDYKVDADAFIKAVQERDATSLAIRPISLRFLLGVFAIDEGLPRSKAKLFDEGTLILCSEEAAWQRGRTRPNADAFRRRAIAARLAALATLTNRHTIAKHEDSDSLTLPARAAAGGIEAVGGVTYSVDAQAVDDTLSGTALFTARTAATFGWSHQSYREYLAAWYLAQHQIDVGVATDIYFSGGASRVPGPLREVAAWHATFAPAIFDLIVARDPEVLLHSDSAAVSPESRAQLVQALLDRMASFQAVDAHLRRRQYATLKHPELAKQVRPYIAARNANIIVRRASMDIARACGVQEVVDDLVAVLEDREDELQAREVAAHALAQLGGERVREAFVKLLAEGCDPDPNDSIRGSAMRLLWPEYLDAKTLFRHLTIPQRDDYYGSYQRLIDEVPAALRPEELPSALDWVERLGDRTSLDLERAQQSILDVALTHLGHPGVIASLCRIIRRSLRTHLGPWATTRTSRDEKRKEIGTTQRRAIVAELLRTAHDETHLASGMIYSRPPLLMPIDIPWLAAEADKQVTAVLARALGECVAALYMRFGYPTDVEATDAVISVNSSAFREPLAGLINAVDLESEHAKKQRQQFEEWSERSRDLERSGDEREEHEPSRWSVASKHLEAVETGNPEAWVGFALEWAGDMPGRVETVPEWATLSPADRDRVVVAATQFLTVGQAPDPSWVDEGGRFPWSAVAARAALNLICVVEPKLLDELSPESWRRWCHVLVGVTLPEFSDDACAELFRRCSALSELHETIIRIARRENKGGGHAHVLNALPEPMNPGLQSTVFGLLDELGDKGFADALELLVRSGNIDALERGRSAIRDASPARAAHAACVVLPRDGTLWPAVISRLRTDLAFLQIFASLVSFDEDLAESPFVTITEDFAAQVFLAVLRQVPAVQDATGPNGFLGTFDHVVRLYNRMFGTLVKSGTTAGIAALEWLIAQEPDRDELKYGLVQARERHSDATWKPFAIEMTLRVLGVALVATAVRSDGRVRCLMTLRPGASPQIVSQQIGSLVPDALVAASSSDALTIDVPTGGLPRFRATLEETPSVRDAVLALKCGDEWLFEAVPAISMDDPVRVDVSTSVIQRLFSAVDVLVETATDTETQALHAAMTALPGHDGLVVGSIGVATYTIGRLGQYAVAHLQSDMGAGGPNGAIVATIDAIAEVQPKVVLLVGIAFGINRTKQRLGDVLAAQHVTGYEVVKVSPASIEERDQTLSANVILSERIKAHKRSWRFSREDGSQVAVHPGQVLSGAKLINSRDFRDALAGRFPLALGGEMEGIGAYAAAFRRSIPVLLVKAICDWADGLKNNRAQVFAATTAVSLVRYVLDKPDVLAALGVATPDWSKGPGPAEASALSRPAENPVQRRMRLMADPTNAHILRELLRAIVKEGRLVRPVDVMGQRNEHEQRIAELCNAGLLDQWNGGEFLQPQPEALAYADAADSEILVEWSQSTMDGMVKADIEKPNTAWSTVEIAERCSLTESQVGIGLLYARYLVSGFNPGQMGDDGRPRIATLSRAVRTEPKESLRARIARERDGHRADGSRN